MIIFGITDFSILLFPLHGLIYVYAVGALFLHNLGFLLRTRKLCGIRRKEEFHPHQSRGCPGQLCSASWCSCPVAGHGASTAEQSEQVLFKPALPRG